MCGLTLKTPSTFFGFITFFVKPPKRPAFSSNATLDMTLSMTLTEERLWLLKTLQSPQLPASCRFVNIFLILFLIF
jgi:hypothetical protein